MSSTDNSARLRHFLEEVEFEGDFGAFKEYIHPDVVLPSDMPGGKQGLDGLVEALASYRTGIEYRMTVQDMIAEGDKVVVRNLISGKQIGEFMGLAGVGKDFEIEEIMIAQFHGDRVSRFWRVADRFALMQQLGAASG